MPNRRTGLKLRPSLAVVPDEHEARVGGIGLDFEDVPAMLDADGRAEWHRLAGIYERTPTRFREGDRAAVTAYCAYFAAFRQAAADVAERGTVVEGRSARDRGRMVKNPATVAMREASTQLRYWARELGLTPDARGRAGIREAEPPPPGGASRNPFTPPSIPGGAL